MFRLTRRAEEDIVGIYVESARLFGHRQAEIYVSGIEAVFEFLSENPRAARERTEIVPPVRIHPYKSHIIVYLIDPHDDILIVRVRHAHEDWVTDPL